METIYEIQRIRQIISESKLKKYLIRSPEDAADVARQFIDDDDREVFFVMCLDTKNQVIAVHRAHVGSLNASIVHPREVFKAAILNNSASIIASHQHPSGDPKPSQEDIHITRRIAESGKIIGIELLDHIILGDKSQMSLKEKGYV